jgi:hypothetical protein
MEYSYFCLALFPLALSLGETLVSAGRARASSKI